MQSRWIEHYSPRASVRSIDYEVELVIRLGDDLRPVSMCIGCDTTNRTRQSLAKEKSWPWLESKSFIGSAVLGTWTVWDPRPKMLMLSVNGELRQSESTELMVCTMWKHN